MSSRRSSLIMSITWARSGWRCGATQTGLGSGRQQFFDRDVTPLDYMHAHLMTVEQAHRKEWICIGNIYCDALQPPAPQDDRFMNIECSGAAVAEHRASIPAKRKAECRDDLWRQSEIAI